MRLYHRRSSVYKDRALINTAAERATTCATDGRKSQPQIVATVPHLMYEIQQQQRQRSHSLFPMDSGSGIGTLNSSNTLLLCVPPPPRSRSNSFSGVHVARISPCCSMAELTDKEEDYIFNCYAKVMYLILGLTAMLLIFVIYRTMQTIFCKL